MSAQIRLGCHQCDRCDFDGIDELPSGWADITFVQSLEDSHREVEPSQHAANIFEWYTHLGTCPECQAEDQ